MELQLILLLSIFVITNADDTGFQATNGSLSAEALYMKQGNRARFSYEWYKKRPGEATNTHSCHHVRGVPEELRTPEHMRPKGLTQFYQKYTEAYGIPVVSSANVDDDALKRACYTLRFILADSVAMRHSFYHMGGRVAIIGKNEKTNQIPEHSHLDDWWNRRARGLGATTGTPISTGAEENALCMLDRDRWGGDDIVLHEYLHGLHALGANHAFPGFGLRMENLYNDMKDDGRWGTLYAMSTNWEYFSETGQSYLNSHISVGPPHNGIHNHISTRDQLRQFDRVMYDLHAKEMFPCNNTYIRPCDGNLTSTQRRDQENAQVLRMDCDGTKPPSSADECQDHAEFKEHCPAYKQMCTTEPHKNSLKYYCKKTCGFC